MAYVGDFNKRQGIETLINSIPAVIKDFPEVSFVIAGGGPERDDYIRLVAQMGLSDSVSFPGYLPVEKMAPLLRRSSVAVAPYYGLYRDAIPMASPAKIYDYLAC